MTTTKRKQKPRTSIPPERLAEIAKRIRDLRIDQGLQSNELAKAADIDDATMSLAENAARPPALSTVLALADALGVEPGALLNRKQTAASAPQSQTHVDQSLTLSTIQAATSASFAEIVAVIVAALGDWHAAHVLRENERLDAGTRRLSRADRR